MHTEVVPTCVTGGRQRRMRHGLFPSTRGGATSADGVYVVDMDEIPQSQQTALQPSVEVSALPANATEYRRSDSDWTEC